MTHNDGSMIPKDVPDPTANPVGLPPGRDWSAFRLVAVDLDGTLADKDGRVNGEGIQALQEAERAGLHPVIVTGRALPAAVGVWLRAGLSRPVVAFDGAVAALPAAGRALWRRPLDDAVVRRALDLAYRFDLVPFLYTPDAIATDRRGPYRDLLAHLNEMPVTVLGDEQGAQLPESPAPEQAGGPGGAPPGAQERLAAWRPGQVLKVVLGGPPPVLDRVEGDLRAELSGLPAVVARTLPQLVEVVRPDATKESALVELCRWWGIPPEQVIAIGDSGNDLGMIRWAGLGVAVANARPEVLRAADWVIGHHADGAVARFLRAVVAARQGRRAEA
ncbi:MAG TPA: HAD family hydrolase [Thermaerobacter sp.]